VGKYIRFLMGGELLVAVFSKLTTNNHRLNSNG
jgi:hypothetical protein